MTHLMRATIAAGLLVVLCPGGLLAAPVKPCELMKALSSSDARTGREAITRCVERGSAMAVPLVCFMGGKMTGVPRPTDAGKARTEEALVGIGGGAVPGILQYLASQDEELRTRLVRTLGRIVDPRREAPIRGLWKTEPSDRVRAVLVPGYVSLSRPRSEAMPALRERLPAAGARERVALGAQVALFGSNADLTAVLRQVKAADRAGFATAVVAEARHLRALRFPGVTAELVERAVRRLRTAG